MRATDGKNSRRERVKWTGTTRRETVGMKGKEEIRAGKERQIVNQEREAYGTHKHRETGKVPSGKKMIK